MYLNDISNEFEGQGHRSKVKVIRLQNVIFEVTEDDLFEIVTRRARRGRARQRSGVFIGVIIIWPKMGSQK